MSFKVLPRPLLLLFRIMGPPNYNNALCIPLNPGRFSTQRLYDYVWKVIKQGHNSLWYSHLPRSTGSLSKQAWFQFPLDKADKVSGPNALCSLMFLVILRGQLFQAHHVKARWRTLTSSGVHLETRFALWNYPYQKQVVMWISVTLLCLIYWLFIEASIKAVAMGKIIHILTFNSNIVGSWVILYFNSKWLCYWGTREMTYWLRPWTLFQSPEPRTYMVVYNHP